MLQSLVWVRNFYLNPFQDAVNQLRSGRVSLSLILCDYNSRNLIRNEASSLPMLLSCKEQGVEQQQAGGASSKPLPAERSKYRGNTKKYTTFRRKRYYQKYPPPWTPRAPFVPPAMHLPNGKRYHLSSARRIRTASINNDDVRIHQQFFFTTFVFCQHNHQIPMEASFLPYFHHLILITMVRRGN